MRWAKDSPSHLCRAKESAATWNHSAMTAVICDPRELHWLRNIIEYESCCRYVLQPWKSKILQFIDEFPIIINTSFLKGFPIAMFDSKRVMAYLVIPSQPPPLAPTTCVLFLRLLQLQGRSGLHAYLPPWCSMKKSPFHVSPYPIHVAMAQIKMVYHFWSKLFLAYPCIYMCT